MRIRFDHFAVALAAFLLPGMAHASFIGHELLIEWHFPALGRVFAAEDVVVGAGIEFSARALGPNIDVGRESIDFSGASGFVFADRPFNGFVFADIAGTLADIAGVRILDRTGYIGFTPADISFSADRIQLQFAGVDHITGPENKLRLRVQFTDSVPEPATLALASAAFLAAGAVRRRRQRRRPAGPR